MFGRLKLKIAVFICNLKQITIFVIYIKKTKKIENSD